MHSVQFKTINPPQCKSEISEQLVVVVVIVCFPFCLFVLRTTKKIRNSTTEKRFSNNFLWSFFYWYKVFCSFAERTQQSFQLNWKPDLIIVDFIGSNSIHERSNFYDFSSIYGSWKWMNECMYEWTAKHLARDFPLPFLLTLSVNTIETEESSKWSNVIPIHRSATLTIKL